MFKSLLIKEKDVSIIGMPRDIIGTNNARETVVFLLIRRDRVATVNPRKRLPVSPINILAL